MTYSKIRKVRLSKYDKIWAQFDRERDGVCLVCGKKEYLAAHHFKGRACKATRLILDIGITLCAGHHVFNHEFSAHKTPEAFERWFKKEYPGRCKMIGQLAQTIVTERQAIKDFYENYNLV